MWWKAIKVAGIVGVALLTLLFIILLIAVTRPAVLFGVPESSLSSSMTDAQTEAGCWKDERKDWVCELDDGTRYRVDVNWMGCWKAEPADPVRDSNIPVRRRGCIELGDLISFD